MGVGKGPFFDERDVFVDYAFEQVMFRWDHVTKKIYKRFYGESEKAKPVSHDNRLYNDALRFGDEITREQYEQGKPRR
jgi:hypothetical protein